MSYPAIAIPLTANQQVQYEYIRTHPESDHYLIHAAFHVGCLLDASRLAYAIENVSRRHQPLRARFVEDNDKRTMMLDDVRPCGAFISSTVDCDDLQEASRRMFLDYPPIDLGRGPAWRLTLIRNRRNSDCMVGLVASHLVMDHQSVVIFFRELAASYNGVHLGAQKASYADLRLAQGKWRKALADDVVTARGRQLRTCSTPWDADGEGTERTYTSAVATLPEPGGQLLGRVASHCHIPASVILLSSLGNVLADTTGVAETLIGIPYAARPFPGSENLIGDFSNTLLVAGRASQSRAAGIQDAKREFFTALELWPIHINELLGQLAGAAFQIRMEVADDGQQLASAFTVPGVITTLTELRGYPRTMRRALAVTCATADGDASVEVCLAAGSRVGVSAGEFATMIASETAAHCRAALND